MSEKTFFLKAAHGHMSLRDIFSDVFRKHTPDETARVFIAGTSLTTPSESEMLAGWQKPFLFARFFLATALTMLVALLLPLMGCHRGYDVVLVGLPILVPFTVLLLTWEMNIPRSISLSEVLGIVTIGGAFSLVFTILFEMINPLQGAQWAPVTEEPAKLLIILLLLRKKNYKYITEGILLGMAVGTGFAIMETLSYVMDSLRTSMVIASVTTSDTIIEMFNQGYPIDYIAMIIFDSVGAASGLSTAMLRAINAVAGHGMLAAFYGGGILMAKQQDAFQAKHLFNIHFLKYFAVSFLLHFFNNLDLTAQIFPFIGPIWTYSFVQTIVAIALFLPLMRQGVNQVVNVTLQHYDGHLTIAIERNDNSDVQQQEQLQQYQRQVQQYQQQIQQMQQMQYQQQQQQYRQQYSQAAPSARAVVQFLSGPHAGKSYTIGAGRAVSMGRTPGQCGLAMPSCNKVSSRHLSLEIRDRAVYVTDLNSTNGTYVGSQRLHPNVPTAVPNGSVVYLGTQSCSFRVYLQ